MKESFSEFEKKSEFFIVRSEKVLKMHTGNYYVVKFQFSLLEYHIAITNNLIFITTAQTQHIDYGKIARPRGLFNLASNGGLLACLVRESRYLIYGL